LLIKGEKQKRNFLLVDADLNLDKQSIKILKCLPGALFTPRVCSLVQNVIQIHPEKREVQNVDSSQLPSEVNFMEKLRKLKVVERSSSERNKTKPFPEPGECSYLLLQGLCN
jgi:hypothetical protein